ncbi:hypothetical protein RS030_142159 [Cryptosporidium xiaoi]|uniref:Trafficking protein particle complex subunit 13 N-terminal domain-containing protein n=1 Tax=Cryptosporidium xiaoi TaxID=659607 RepID=A0AAV9Y1L3_9CRYT
MSEILSLKVMSLSHSPVDSQTSTLKLLPNNIENFNEESLCIDNMFPLLLPTSQCRLYSGESFHAFLSISNSSIIKANGVVLKVELIGINKTHVLYNNEDNYKEIDIGDSMNIVVKERVDEVGLYNLICQLFFTSNDVRLTQKKSYKFTVLSPFNISHRIYRVDEKCVYKKRGYIEVSLENISHQSLTLSDMSLIPLNLNHFSGLELSIEDLNETEEEYEPIFIHSKCRYNKIFVLKFTFLRDKLKLDDYIENLKMSLKVVWRSKNFGESWLDSHKISYPILTREDIASERIRKEEKLVVTTEFPPVVDKQEEFKLKLYIRNNFGQKLKNIKVKLDFDKLLPIVVVGSDTLEIPEISENGTKIIELNCMSLVPGVHNIEGISVSAIDNQEVSLPKQSLYSIFKTLT